MHLNLRCSLLAVAVPLIVASAANAQPAQPPEPTIEFRFGTGATHQFDTDIDDGGEFSVTRAHGGISATYEFNPDLKLDAAFGYEFSSYDFSGTAGFGGLDPWEDIHSIRFSARFTYRLDEQWSLFGGPVFTLSAEDGADLGDGFAPGGLVGATYRFSDELTLGGGLFVVGEIEDDVAVFPTIIVNWKINDEWTLRNSRADFGPGSLGGGLEAAWAFAADFEVAFGVGYQWRQFKLDDSGMAPDGVGIELSVPLYADLTWNINPTASLNVMAAVAVTGELELQDSGGNTISEQDYDPAALIGARLTLKF